MTSLGYMSAVSLTLTHLTLLNLHLKKKNKKKTSDDPQVLHFQIVEVHTHRQTHTGGYKSCSILVIPYLGEAPFFSLVIASFSI